MVNDRGMESLPSPSEVFTNTVNWNEVNGTAVTVV